MSIPVYVVTMKHKSGHSGGMSWFWDSSEAQTRFDSNVSVSGDEYHVTLQRIILDDDSLEAVIQEIVETGEGDVMGVHNPDEPEKPEYTTLRYDTQNHEILYIERTEGGEFWAYTVEKQTNTSWIVKEQMTGDRIGRIYQDTPTALLPHYDVEIRADESPIGSGNSLQQAVEVLIGYVSGDFQ